MKEALFYTKEKDGAVRCAICQRRCMISEGKRGYCWTRFNKDGRLYSLTYGRVATLAISPIEKKPLYHFYPASRWLSLGSLGCNFRCPGCQNWEIAHRKIDEKATGTEFLSPEEAVRMAKNSGCKGISWTYNEPTLWFEYTLESAKLAHQEGLLTNYVTNGSITPEALDRIGPYLDAFRVDIKGFSEETYRKFANLDDFEGILKVTRRAKENWGMWVEIVTNVTPTFNDSETELRGIADWIVRDLGLETPWHITRFFPHLDLASLEPTPVRTLEKARQIGLGAGLKFVYLGNVAGHPGENTYCPKCETLLIKRSGLSATQILLENGKCPKCHTLIPGHF